MITEFRCDASKFYEAASAAAKLTPLTSGKHGILVKAGDGKIYLYRNNSEAYACADINGATPDKFTFALGNFEPLKLTSGERDFSISDGHMHVGGMAIALSAGDVYEPLEVGVDLVDLPADALKCTWPISKDTPTYQASIVFYENYIGAATSYFWSYYRTDGIMYDGVAMVPGLNLPKAGKIGFSGRYAWLTSDRLVYRTTTFHDMENHLAPIVDMLENGVVEIASIQVDDELVSRINQGLELSRDGWYREGLVALNIERGGSLIVESRPTETGFITEGISTPFEADVDVTIAFNPTQLLRAIRSCTDDAYLNVIKRKGAESVALMATDGKIKSVVNQMAHWRK